jgi:D-psicose/D-tagatose/L-ribulose 3-epimerase
MIKFSASNIAWSPKADREVSEFLKTTNISGVEIALSRYFDDVENVPDRDLILLKSHWENLGFPITSLQSLLFNRPDLQLFESDLSRKKLARFLLSLGTKAAMLGAGPMVFGSPKNRDRGELSSEEASTIAYYFFKELGNRWFENSSYLVLEANPEIYSCNFITKSSEALKLVNAVDSKYFKWHVDLACTENSGESSVELILTTKNLPAHIHISETDLEPLVDSNFHLYQNFIKALRVRRYKGVVTLEMRETSDLQDFINSVEILNEACR